MAPIAGRLKACICAVLAATRAVGLQGHQVITVLPRCSQIAACLNVYSPDPNEKAGPFQIRLSPPVADGNKHYAALKIARELNTDEPRLDQNIVKRAARWC